MNWYDLFRATWGTHTLNAQAVQIWESEVQHERTGCGKAMAHEFTDGVRRLASIKSNGDKFQFPPSPMDLARAIEHIRGEQRARKRSEGHETARPMSEYVRNSKAVQGNTERVYDVIASAPPDIQDALVAELARLGIEWEKPDFNALTQKHWEKVGRVTGPMDKHVRKAI